MHIKSNAQMKDKIIISKDLINISKSNKKPKKTFKNSI